MLRAHTARQHTGRASRRKHHPASKHSRSACGLAHARKSVPVARERLAAEGQYRGAAAPRNQLQQRLQLLPNPNPNRQPLPWQEVKQVPACVQSGWPLFSDTGEDAVPKPKPKPKPKPIKLTLL